jgi:hypothetical protein
MRSGRGRVFRAIAGDASVAAPRTHPGRVRSCRQPAAHRSPTPVGTLSDDRTKRCIWARAFGECRAAGVHTPPCRGGWSGVASLRAFGRSLAHTSRPTAATQSSTRSNSTTARPRASSLNSCRARQFDALAESGAAHAAERRRTDPASVRREPIGSRPSRRPLVPSESAVFLPIFQAQRAEPPRMLGRSRRRVTSRAVTLGRVERNGARPRAGRQPMSRRLSVPRRSMSSLRFDSRTVAGATTGEHMKCR